MSDVQDLIQIQESAIDAPAAISAVTHSAAGGIAVFFGTTRAEISPEGKSLLALDYDAYTEMAKKQLGEFANHARQRWNILGLAILHRVGRVEVGQASVLIAVSTPHRAEAFEACRFLIDILKQQAAIWKKEVWSDGSASWVHPANK